MSNAYVSGDSMGNSPKKMMLFKVMHAVLGLPFLWRYQRL